MKTWAVSKKTLGLFDQAHLNTVIVGVLFKLQAGAADKTDYSYQIYLRRFRYTTLVDDEQAYWTQYLTRTYCFCPLQYYDETMTTWALEEQQTPAGFATDLSADQLVYLRFETEQAVGCCHYCRGCLKYCPRCCKFYGCRMCHDAAEDHYIDTSSVTTLKCRKCWHVQPFYQSCERCGLIFGWYCCKICKLICDLGADFKPIFHSGKQKACAIGIESKMRYCDKCNWNFTTSSFGNHMCYRIDGETCCCCYEVFGNDTKPRIVLYCGHIIHAVCSEYMIYRELFGCPVCQRTMISKQNLRDYYIFFHYLEKKYFCLLRFAEYLCCDCLGHFKHFENSFVVFCPECESFNTKLVNYVDYPDERLSGWLECSGESDDGFLKQLAFRSTMEAKDFCGRVSFTDEEFCELDCLLQNTRFHVTNELISQINQLINQSESSEISFVRLFVQTFFPSTSEPPV